MSKFLVLLLAVSFMATTVTFADDSDDAAALREAQELMRSESKRAEVIKDNAKAQQADSFALQAVGGDQKLKNDVYNVSADIMGTVKDLAGGDPVKMNELLQKALKDPGAFLKSLPADQQAKIRSIANQTEANKKGSSKP